MENQELKDRLIKDYESEIEQLKVIKRSGVDKLKTSTWNLNDLIETEAEEISTDEVITLWESQYELLKACDPKDVEQYNY